MYTLYLSFCFFAFVATVTPGPTNLLAFSNGYRFGVKATLPFIIGSSISAAGILYITATGISELLMQWVWLQQFLAWAGTLWLSWMAVELYHAPVHTKHDNAVATTSLSFTKGIGLQVVNPKVWVMALTVSTVFALQSEMVISYSQHFRLLALIFFLFSCPCLSAWAVLGKTAKLHINSLHHQQLINRALAILLGLTIWWAQIHSTLDALSTTHFTLV